MEMSNLTKPLLFGQENRSTQYTNDSFVFENDDDSSSGYDSTDISDTESVMSIGSRGSCENLVPARGDREKVMHFRSTQALCENLKLILAMPDMCDVTFLVGPNEIPVHGVRAIMGTRSRVFYQLILKHMSIRSEQDKKPKSKKSSKAGKQTVGLSRSLSDRLTIPVKKFDSEVFRVLVQFVHCGTVNITEETVAGLFCGASQFELPDLANACLDFVGRCLISGRCENLLVSTRSYSHHKASQTLFDKIYAVLDTRYTTDTCSELSL